MITIITTNDDRSREELAETNSFLLKEGQIMTIKNAFGKSKFQKIDNKLIKIL